MPAFLRFFWPLPLIFSLAACATRPAVPPVVGQQAGQQSDILAQTSWTLVSWTRPDGGQRPVPQAQRGERAITMVFTREQGQARVSGFAGCNNYSGPYVMANGQLLITQPPASTYMACPAANMQLEQEYLAGLPRINASRLDNDMRPTRMTLTLLSGDVLDFARQGDPIVGGQQGPTKLVYVNSERVPCTAGAGRATCYQVRENLSQPWQLWYGDIQGFNFQPGIEYRLRVVEVRDPNPPADASSVRWVLDLVVEQRVVQH